MSKGHPVSAEKERCCRGRSIKPREVFQEIYRESVGILSAKSHVLIIGAGISGLHLAHAFCAAGHRVTVYDVNRAGGQRIPLMHACLATKSRKGLWESAAAFSRDWYRLRPESEYITPQEGNFGTYFVIRTRAYLNSLKASLISKCVTFRQTRVPSLAAVAQLADIVFLATGTGANSMLNTHSHPAFWAIDGLESYCSIRGAEILPANISNLESASNADLLLSPPRAAIIHRNKDLPEAARQFAGNLYPTARHALFQGSRLVTRDRNPIVGFWPSPDFYSYGLLREYYRKPRGSRPKTENSVFMFCAMGYHAMTYAPFLANRVASWLSGNDTADENLICTLTPTRFLTRK